jgi:hypothetical protein
LISLTWKRSQRLIFPFGLLPPAHGDLTDAAPFLIAFDEYLFHDIWAGYFLFLVTTREYAFADISSFFKRTDGEPIPWRISTVSKPVTTMGTRYFAPWEDIPNNP